MGSAAGAATKDLDFLGRLDNSLENPLRRWSLSRAWPVKFVAGEWDNESDENVIESVTPTYDFFELVQ